MTMDTAHLDRTIVAQIRSAFDGVTLGKGISLKQAQAMDQYNEGVTDTEFEALPRSEIPDSWPDVPLNELERD